MTISQRGLGRGLDALMRNYPPEPQPTDTMQMIALSAIIPCAFQPRKVFHEEQLNELAQSIQSQGIVQPLVVRPLSESPQTFEIVAGERRWRAAKMIGLHEVPVIIRQYSDSEAMTIALVENLQRENLNAIEEAEAFFALKEKYNLSQEELAVSLGKSRPALANSLRLLKLPEDIRNYLFESKLSAAHGRTLLGIDDAEVQSQAAERIIENNLSVRDTESLVEYANTYHKLPENSIADMPNKEKNSAQKRRINIKSPEFIELQKNLRAQFHRGTTITGTLENGKIILPFMGQEELDHLLHLLSYDIE